MELDGRRNNTTEPSLRSQWVKHTLSQTFAHCEQCEKCITLALASLGSGKTATSVVHFLLQREVQGRRQWARAKQHTADTTRCAVCQIRHVQKQLCIHFAAAQHRTAVRFARFQAAQTEAWYTAQSHASHATQIESQLEGTQATE